MRIQGSNTRDKLVTIDHLHSFRRSLETLVLDGSFEVDERAIGALVERSGDTYIWHTKPGAAFSESAVLRERTEGTSIDRESRLAHGALGLLYALETSHVQSPNRPIRGIAGLRYTAPVFEGTRMRARVAPEQEGESLFEVTSDAFDTGPAITGRLLYGMVDGPYDASTFASEAEQQLFALEEAIGLLSALIGLWVERAGGRVLYMGQELLLGGLVGVGDRLHAVGTVMKSTEGKRTGWRTTARVVVDVEREGGHVPVASGESIFLSMDAD